MYGFSANAGGEKELTEYPAGIDAGILSAIMTIKRSGRQGSESPLVLLAQFRYIVIRFRYLDISVFFHDKHYKGMKGFSPW